MNENRFFAALAWMPRRKIVASLSKASLTAGEIADRFEMTKPSVSKHLRILEHAGLIKSEKRGQFIHYSVADDNMLGTLYGLLATFCPVGGPLKRESRALARARKATTS